MNASSPKIYTTIMQFSIVVFALTLGWFSFVYYPKVVNQYKNVATVQKPAGQVSANFENFPIETDAYRIDFDKKSGNYYVFIGGSTINQYVQNKNSAELALKSALSQQSLCKLNIVYASVGKLTLSSGLKSSTGCK